MFRLYRPAHAKKPATLLGRGLAVSTETDQHLFASMALLQLHSIFVRGRLLLGQAVDIAAAQ